MLEYTGWRHQHTRGFKVNYILRKCVLNIKDCLGMLGVSGEDIGMFDIKSSYGFRNTGKLSEQKSKILVICNENSEE